MRLSLIAASAAAILALCAVTPVEAQTVGSSARLTHRNCTGADAMTGCPTLDQHFIASEVYGGGLGVGGATVLDIGGGNRVWSNVTLGAFDLPQIAAYASAPGDMRLNANVFAFQSYLFSGPTGTAFSISSDLHIVDSSGSPLGDGLLPGGATYTQYLGIWDPSVLGTYSTARELHNALFYATCFTPGVLGMATGGSDITTTGEHVFTLTTTACAPGSLNLTSGQEVLVVSGFQIPVNRGGFIDASHTLTSRFGDDLSPETIATLEGNLQSAVSRGASFAVAQGAIPETESWIMLILGFLATGSALRRQRAHGRAMRAA